MTCAKLTFGILLFWPFITVTFLPSVETYKGTLKYDNVKNQNKETLLLFYIRVHKNICKENPTLINYFR